MFKVGDRVKTKKGRSILNECWIGKTGTIIGENVERWPWNVKFDDGQTYVFKEDEMELLQSKTMKAKQEIMG